MQSSSTSLLAGGVRIDSTPQSASAERMARSRWPMVGRPTTKRSARGPGVATGAGSGCVGAVVDGAIRDIDEIKALRFPIFSRAIVPRSTHSPYSKRLEPIEVNVPIQCGGVLVSPGDIVLADEIGVVVIPREQAGEVLARAQAQAAQEEATRQRIRQGKTVEEILAEFGRL